MSPVKSALPRGSRTSSSSEPRVVETGKIKFPSESLGLAIHGTTPASTTWSPDPYILPTEDAHNMENLI